MLYALNKYKAQIQLGNFKSEAIWQSDILYSLFYKYLNYIYCAVISILLIKHGKLFVINFFVLEIILKLILTYAVHLIRIIDTLMTYSGISYPFCLEKISL